MLDETSNQLWLVIGGADKGGILVREGRDLKSAEVSERLATGAVVKQLALEGERLHFRKLSGAGPDTGWVSYKLKGKLLVDKFDETKPLRHTLQRSGTLEDNCGANYMQQNTKFQTRGDGASRAAFFDSLIEEHVAAHGRVELRGKIPQHLYDTRLVDDEQCLMYVRSLGNVCPDPPASIAKHKKAPGGIHQYVATLGGLLCINIEADGVERKSMTLLLAHGNNAPADDLYGLGHRLVQLLPHVQVVLAEAPFEVAQDDEDWRRPARQWWMPGQKDVGAVQAGQALATCAAAVTARYPKAKLILGGMSEGCIVGTLSTASLAEGQPAALLCFAPSAFAAELPSCSLSGVHVLVGVGDADKVSSTAHCEQLLHACAEAGAKTHAVLRYVGGHDACTGMLPGLISFVTSLLVK
eukprot:TRINITY_DN23623_c0_g1_i1.p1 TRINITY_DN23623_c0_g1~~TRINITY_DN23623_c0_g1_i1.p1  ORF type:complete len:411 (+),score=65.66 TRINITY_DN23623_c0_g1_i1:88-1320(+)